jgi:hypothetical protein
MERDGGEYTEGNQQMGKTEQKRQRGGEKGEETERRDVAGET